MKILSLYASLLAVLFLYLSIKTIRLRRKLKIGVGDAGSPQMLRAMRVNANFSEYVPLSLLLIYLVEVSGAHPWAIHALGLALLLGRLLHAYGVSQTNENFKFRISGMLLTFTVLIVSSIYLLISFLFFS